MRVAGQPVGEPVYPSGMRADDVLPRREVPLGLEQGAWPAIGLGRPPPTIRPPGHRVPRLSPSCPGFFRYANCVRSQPCLPAAAGPPGPLLIARANGLSSGRVPGPAYLALGCCGWGHLSTPPDTCPRTSRCSPRGLTQLTSAVPNRSSRPSAPLLRFRWPARSGPGPPSRSAPAAAARVSGCCAGCARAPRSPAWTPSPSISGWPEGVRPGGLRANQARLILGRALDVLPRLSDGRTTWCSATRIRETTRTTCPPRCACCGRAGSWLSITPCWQELPDAGDDRPGVRPRQPGTGRRAARARYCAARRWPACRGQEERLGSGLG